MNKKPLRAFSLFCFVVLVIPASGAAQCKDQLCRNVQNILDAAVTDFREYRANRVVVPDISLAGAKVPCQMTAWANNVPMLICYAQIPSQGAESWYAGTLESLRILEPTWQFKLDSPAADHFVDAGPADCVVPDTEGPYLGHCPLHLQATKQNDGTSKVYLWTSSLSSPYLVNRPPAPPKKTAPAAVAVTIGCDDLCQGLKRAFEARASGFEDLRAAKTSGTVSDATLKLAGAAQCAVNATSKSRSNGAATQFVCYWTETPASAADTRFRDLMSRLQILVPSTWSIRQEDESEELTGVKVKAWCAAAPDNKQEACTYISGESVGLHIKSWN
jgi:hypothetical protein